MANENGCKKGISLSYIGSGICIVVVAALIIWMCSSVQSHETRLTLSEDRYGRIQRDISDIKFTIEKSAEEQSKLLYEIRQDQIKRQNMQRLD